MSNSDVRILCPAYHRLINQDVCQWHAFGGWGQQPDPKCQGCKVAKTQEKEGNDGKEHEQGATQLGRG